MFRNKKIYVLIPKTFSTNRMHLLKPAEAIYLGYAMDGTNRNIYKLNNGRQILAEGHFNKLSEALLKSVEELYKNNFINK